jgi:hypothetical protein
MAILRHAGVAGKAETARLGETKSLVSAQNGASVTEMDAAGGTLPSHSEQKKENRSQKQ